MAAQASLAQTVRRMRELIPAELPTDRRWIVALAGPPAAGKSTLADALCADLGRVATVVALDGFHYDDGVLDARGVRDRKGAPFTFDVDGYAALLRRLRLEPRNQIAAPVFDRALEISRGSANLVEPSHRVIVTEGNWLLHHTAPWNELRSLFDRTIFVSAPHDLIRTRILERWHGHGLDGAEALRKAEQNDLPNAAAVLERAVSADLVLTTG